MNLETATNQFMGQVGKLADVVSVGLITEESGVFAVEMEDGTDFFIKVIESY